MSFSRRSSSASTSLTPASSSREPQVWRCDCMVCKPVPTHLLSSPPHHQPLTSGHRLVANLGHNTTSKKLNRKAIENVNVPQACDTIEKPPGAPIALKLQGNLLYGISGVYHKHSAYLLDDTEKMWTRMRTYFRECQSLAANGLDPKAGKAKYVTQQGTKRSELVC